MDPGAIRHLRSPSGITKANKQGRRPGKIACTACHARKKRCDIVPPYNQCTHCRKENQCCIPRDSIDRYVKRRKRTDTSKSYKAILRPIRPQMPNRSHNIQKAASNYEDQFQVNGFLPKELDHEIPRWSAVYSAYSEMRRLLPFLTSASPSPSPEIEGQTAYMQTAANETKLDVPSSGEPSRRPQSRSRSRSRAPIDEGVGLEKALACEAEILHGGLLHGGLSSTGKLRDPSGGGFGPAYDAFMNDLDALLRF
jgi:hypothetical protein